MADEQEKIDFSHSNTDLMASIAVIFLLLAVAMILANSAAVSKAENAQEKLNAERNEFNNEIRDLLDLPPGGKDVSDDGCIRVINDDLKSEIRIRFIDGHSAGGERCRGLTFGTAKFELDGDGDSKNILIKLARISSRACQKKSVGKDSPIWRLSIEGHTDTDRYLDFKRSDCKDPSEEFCGNLYLSAQRAREVYLWIARTMATDQKISRDKQCFEKMALISGRGPLDPVEEGDRETAAVDDEADSNLDGKQSNRRVEYIVHFKVAKIEASK
ncbi:MAG: hypothetical protein J0L82_10175 [Deltaproteobacteria bacterium]|jgi:outer membrane protein OmpA-like peptidoglycan-associated protein|nr:hypothetical protein [Deltaproteobacteria bacterium]